MGQEHALEVPVQGAISASDVQSRFGALHAAYYGHSIPDPVQLVTLRVRAVGRLLKPALAKQAAGDSSAVPEAAGARDAFCFARRQVTRFAIFRRAALAPGAHIAGPAIIDEDTTTTIIHSDQRLDVDAYGHLIIRRNAL